MVHYWKSTQHIVIIQKNERVERLLENLIGNVYPAKLANTILKGYELSILVNEAEMFCMSDQFFSTVSLKFKNKFSNMSNRQIGFKDTMILIPISSKFYLCFYHGDKPKYVKFKSYCFLTEEQTIEINVAILKKFVFQVSLYERSSFETK